MADWGQFSNYSPPGHIAAALSKRAREVRMSLAVGQRRSSLAGGVYNYTETLKEKQVCLCVIPHCKMLHVFMLP